MTRGQYSLLRFMEMLGLLGLLVMLVMAAFIVCISNHGGNASPSYNFGDPCVSGRPYERYTPEQNILIHNITPINNTYIQPDIRTGKLWYFTNDINGSYTAESVPYDTSIFKDAIEGSGNVTQRTPVWDHGPEVWTRSIPSNVCWSDERAHPQPPSYYIIHIPVNASINLIAVETP